VESGIAALRFAAPQQAMLRRRKQMLRRSKQCCAARRGCRAAET
jgi:hypothetical protein